MKKAVIALATLALLASCGQTTTTETTTGTTTTTDATTTTTDTTTTTTGNATCDSYYTYMSCAFKKQGMTDEQVTGMLEQTKNSLKSVPAETLAPACQQALDAFKTQMPTEGC